jgi:hypothetical protein
LPEPASPLPFTESPLHEEPSIISTPGTPGTEQSSSLCTGESKLKSVSTSEEQECEELTLPPATLFEVKSYPLKPAIKVNYCTLDSLEYSESEGGPVFVVVTVQCPFYAVLIPFSLLLKLKIMLWIICHPFLKVPNPYSMIVIQREKK